MIFRSNDVSRRGLLRVASAAGLVASLPVVAFADTMQPGETRFRSVSLDTRPLVAKGLPDYAARISRLADPILASVFANRIVTGRSDAPRLVVRIDSLSISNEASAHRFGTDSDIRDWISGAGEIVDAHGGILREAPIETSSPSFQAPGDIMTVEDIRMQRLITVFAEWVDRYL